MKGDAKADGSRRALLLQTGAATSYTWFPALCFYLEPHLLGQFISDSE